MISNIENAAGSQTCHFTPELNIILLKICLIFKSYTLQELILQKCLNFLCFPKAVPSELVCESCQKKVLEAVGKMIRVLEEQMNPGVLSAVETGRNILNIIGAGQPPFPA